MDAVAAVAWLTMLTHGDSDMADITVAVTVAVRKSCSIPTFWYAQLFLGRCVTVNLVIAAS